MNNNFPIESMIVKRVQAYAFPILLAVIAFFMVRLISTIDKSIEKLSVIESQIQDVKERQAEAKGLMQGDINRLNQAQSAIERRLDRIEEKISRWQ
jgi:hypothetical protein